MLLAGCGGAVRAATRCPGPSTSSYASCQKKFFLTKKLFEVTLNTSEDVAEKIFECIEDSESELRVPVGDDAEQFLEMHHEYSKDPQEFKKWLAEEMEKLFTATK